MTKYERFSEVTRNAHLKSLSNIGQSQSSWEFVRLNIHISSINFVNKYLSSFQIRSTSHFFLCHSHKWIGHRFLFQFCNSQFFSKYRLNIWLKSKILLFKLFSKHKSVKEMVLSTGFYVPHQLVMQTPKLNHTCIIVERTPVLWDLIKYQNLTTFFLWFDIQ